MASRTMTRGGYEFGTKVKTVRLRLFPNNTGDPTFTTGDGVTTAANGVASVARSAAGKFLVTLSDPYRALLNFHATFSSAADNVDLYAQAGAVANLGTSTPVTAVVKLKTGSTNTDVAAAGDTFISIALTFEDSSA
jgi:hypothetical protein